MGSTSNAYYLLPALVLYSQPVYSRQKILTSNSVTVERALSRLRLQCKCVSVETDPMSVWVKVPLLIRKAVGNEKRLLHHMYIVYLSGKMCSLITS